MVRGRKPKHFEQAPHLLTQFSPIEQWEAYRTLYARLLVSRGLEERRSVVVSGVPSAFLHAVVCTNLAIVASRSVPVLLVDACLKNPQLHSLLQISNGCGLSEVLRGQRKWEDCVQREVLPGLNILSAGSWSKDAAAFLHTEQMEGLLQEACQSHALVLVDTPPVCDSPDALLVGRYTSGVLLVVWKNVAKCADIQQTVSRLNDACIPSLGSVLVSKTRR